MLGTQCGRADLRNLGLIDAGRVGDQGFRSLELWYFRVKAVTGFGMFRSLGFSVEASAAHPRSHKGPPNQSLTRICID